MDMASEGLRIELMQLLLFSALLFAARGVDGRRLD